MLAPNFVSLSASSINNLSKQVKIPLRFGNRLLTSRKRTMKMGIRSRSSRVFPSDNENCGSHSPTLSSLFRRRCAAPDFVFSSSMVCIRQVLCLACLSLLDSVFVKPLRPSSGWIDSDCTDSCLWELITGGDGKYWDKFCLNSKSTIGVGFGTRTLQVRD